MNKITINDISRITAETDHWYNFSEFCRWELASGGPDPHMKVTAEMCRIDGCDWAETAWRGLCYLGVYNVPMAEQIWKQWPFERAVKETELFLSWFTENWAGITMRRERKSVRSPIKMAKYFETATSWLKTLINRKQNGRDWISGQGCSTPTEWYELAWKDVQQIYSMGRYIAVKYLEYGIQYLGFPIELGDIRAKGGWSPRITLAILWPMQVVPLRGEDSPMEIEVVDKCVVATKTRLLIDYHINISYFEIQVMLCEYRECYIGRRQFPGRSQDSELGYHHKIKSYWGEETKIWEARANIFPHQVLGELNGWNCVREELGKVLYNYGYMWSDLIYDYNLSKNDLAHPVKHGEKPVDRWATGFGKFFKK